MSGSDPTSGAAAGPASGPTGLEPLVRAEQDRVDRIAAFQDPHQEWRRLVAEFVGTASGAQNIGIIGAIGVGGYIALAGLWGSPISGASMNPARTFGPDMAAIEFPSMWAYIAGPLAGAALAVLLGMVLRGPGGGRDGSTAAQGSLATEIADPGRS